MQWSRFRRCACGARDARGPASNDWTHGWRTAPPVPCERPDPPPDQANRVESALPDESIAFPPGHVSPDGLSAVPSSFQLLRRKVRGEGLPELFQELSRLGSSAGAPGEEVQDKGLVVLTGEGAVFSQIRPNGVLDSPPVQWEQNPATRSRQPEMSVSSYCCAFSS